jgi:hypothetical protein
MFKFPTINVNMTKIVWVGTDANTNKGTLLNSGTMIEIFTFYHFLQFKYRCRVLCVRENGELFPPDH